MYLIWKRNKNGKGEQADHRASVSKPPNGKKQYIIWPYHHYWFIDRKLFLSLSWGVWLALQPGAGRAAEWPGRCDMNTRSKALMMLVHDALTWKKDVARRIFYNFFAATFSLSYLLLLWFAREVDAIIRWWWWRMVGTGK